jgi:hypothetical protein
VEVLMRVMVVNLDDRWIEMRMCRLFDDNDWRPGVRDRSRLLRPRRLPRRLVYDLNSR